MCLCEKIDKVIFRQGSKLIRVCIYFQEFILVIWYVHHYAGGPGIGRYSRPYYLSQTAQAQGEKFVVIAASNHHLLDNIKKPGFYDNNGVPYYFIDTPHYVGNGFDRLKNMLSFTYGLIKRRKEIENIEGAPDIIICSSPHPYAYLATYYLSKKYRAKSCFEVRDLWPLSLVELAGVSKFHPLTVFTALIERFAYKTSHKVISLLPEAFSYMKTKGLSEEQWLYIPNGVDESETNISGESVGSEAYKKLQEWHDDNQKVLLYAGALGVPNNLERLILAFKSLEKEDIKLMIVGKGVSESDLKILVNRNHLNQSVAFYSQMSKQSVLDLMKNVDACFISLLPEPIFRFGVSPNKLFDYMLMKKPIVYAIEAGNNPVKEAKCGVSCDPNDSGEIAVAIKKIFSLNENELSMMGENGYNYVINNHSYNQLSAKLLNELKN